MDNLAQIWYKYRRGLVKEVVSYFLLSRGGQTIPATKYFYKSIFLPNVPTKPVKDIGWNVLDKDIFVI